MEILEICPIILEGKLKKKCPSLATSGIKKNWDKNPSSLASHLIKLSHPFVFHPHFLLALIISGSSLSPHTLFHRSPDFPTSTVRLSVSCPFSSEWKESWKKENKQELQTWDSFLITVHSFNAYKIKAWNTVTKNDLPSKLQHFLWLKLTYKVQRNKLCFSSLYL